MTGFDPTAPRRDTDDDRPDDVPDNVVPPEELVEELVEDAPSSGDGDQPDGTQR